MNNVPKIRFNGFSDEWKKYQFHQLFTERHQIGYISDEYPQLSFTIADGVINPEDRKTNNRDFLIIDKENKKYLITEYNDIIYNPANVVYGAIHRNKLKKGVVSPIYRIFETNQDPVFMECIVRNPNFIKQIARRTEGTVTKLKTLKPEAFLKMESFISDNLDEQKKIGLLLENVDNLIKNQTQKIEELTTLKKSLLNRVFPTDSETVPKIRFNGFSNEWAKDKVCKLFKITRGYVLSTTKTVVNKDRKNIYPVYSSQTLNNGLMGYYSEYLYDNAITWTTDGANAGTVRFRPGKFYCTNVCGVLLSNEGYANKMMAEALNNVAWKFVSKVGNPKLMNNTMADIEFKYPSDFDEQKKISELFENIDKLIELNQAKLEKEKNIKMSLLNKLFV